MAHYTAHVYVISAFTENKKKSVRSSRDGPKKLGSMYIFRRLLAFYLLGAFTVVELLLAGLILTMMNFYRQKINKLMTYLLICLLDSIYVFLSVS